MSYLYKFNSDNRFYTYITINNAELLFLFDTGATCSMIGTSSAYYLGLKRYAKYTYVNKILAGDINLALPKLRMEDESFNLQSINSANIYPKIDGILGMDAIKHFSFSLHYNTPKPFGIVGHNIPQQPGIKMNITRDDYSRPFLFVEIDCKPYWILLDTGSTSTVLNFHLPNRVPREIEAPVGTISSFNPAKIVKKYDDVPFYFGDRAVSLSPFLDQDENTSVLGVDLLQGTTLQYFPGKGYFLS